MRVNIALPGGRWVYDNESRLGPPGGFGEVFLGTGEDNLCVAVKRLKISAAEAAHRELRMANVLQNHNLNHVLPVLDAGQDANSDFYFVVMPIAEKSLSTHIQDLGSIEEDEAVSILLDIVSGLSEVEDIVHRDIKPDNILLHDSVWKLADFGIAKFVEESTSIRTLKNFLSPQYAAPEQWDYGSSTAATDIYALGCVGYALLTGQPPFPGPSMENYRRQHMQDYPQGTLSCSARLRGILMMMLRKSSEARPSCARVTEVLQQIKHSQNSNNDRGFVGLSEASAVIVAKAQKEDAAAARKHEERTRRSSLAKEAEHIFRGLRDEFFTDIIGSAPAAVREDEARIRLGNAVLQMKLIGNQGGYAENPFQRSGWDVILGGVIEVRQPNPTYVWGSSLWYAKLSSEDEYRWMEVSYCAHPLVKKRPAYQPLALDNEILADEAASPSMGLWQIAFGPECIDDEDSDDFKERWSDLYAKAVQGQLEHPRRLPLQ